jgi:glutathione synthase
MKLLFILDPLESLKAYKDTSIAMMRAAKARGHDLFVCAQHDLFLRNAEVKIVAKRLELLDDKNWYKINNAEELIPKDFDAILLRKDPPFDNEYLYSTYLLDLAQNQGARVINNPTAVRSWNEKLSVTKFPQFTPEFLVTSNNDFIRKFLNENQDIVLKPLDGMGGSGIFRLTLNDPNIGVILETATQHGTQTIMAQRYLPAIKQGDKRIIIINGEPLPYALARIPKVGETRGNLAAGGTGVAQKLTSHDFEIASTIGMTLKREGLFIVGLDVIGDYLTEINVTSPTGMVEIATQTQILETPCRPAEVFVKALEGI